MRITRFSDLAFRVLFVAASDEHKLSTIDEINAFYGVSKGHLMKVVNTLTRAGFLEAVRGRSGGIRLAMPAEEIRLDAVLRVTETDFRLVECMREENECRISGACLLGAPLSDALEAFLDTLGKYTLADLQLNKKVFLP